LFFYFTGEIKSDFISGADLFIAVDSSELPRLVAPEIASSYIGRKVTALQIDHHTKGGLEQLVDISYVREDVSSTCELIYNVLTELKVKIDKSIATCLLTGIVGDTSSFQNQNTTQESFAIASELMKLGARQRIITDNLFGGREVDSLKAWGLAMERLYINTKYGVAITYLTYNDLEKFGLSSDVYSGIVNFMNSIKGARAVMFLTEEERGTVKVSMRTRDAHVSVANIAKAFGGGGHVKAAGFSFPGTLNMLTEGSNSHIVIV
jgi:phosphoesterase RecJ-like protein